MKSESKSLFVTASGILVKYRKRRVAKKDRLTLSFQFNLQSLKFPMEEICSLSLQRSRYNYLQLLFYAG